MATPTSSDVCDSAWEFTASISYSPAANDSCNLPGAGAAAGNSQHWLSLIERGRIIRLWYSIIRLRWCHASLHRRAPPHNLFRGSEHEGAVEDANRAGR